jgi:RNA polymerase sigma-70 factor (ECF subfamily)
MELDIATSVSLLKRLQHVPLDQAAWAVFVDRYGPPIYQWCSQWKLQQADADDVAQQVMSKLACKMAEFDYAPTKGSFRGWLRTVTVNAVLDFLKWKQRAGNGAGGEANLIFVATLQASEDLSQRLERAYQLDLLHQAMAKVQQKTSVNPMQWEAFRLTTMEDKSPKDAAAELGIPIDHVYVARYRITKMLREEVQGSGEFLDA